MVWYRSCPLPVIFVTVTLRSSRPRLPGEYRVNYHDATDATARMAELDQALWPAALGRPDRRAIRQDFF
jgi:hypothetical protein